ELLAAGLEADTGVAPAVTEPTLPDVGAERVNVTTGRSERFFGTAWLPVFDFTPSLARCDEETRNILNSTRVNFVTGSARLDARSVRAVNALSGAALHCLETAPNLTIEVGGHTDSQGSEEGNQALSLERADAVVAAMIARGVPESALTAQGYGEAQPIADNETPEGRAANRRTTLLWSEN
ncbi:MAG: OmpA family protein, partial [Pseudomonadota bacterium]